MALKKVNSDWLEDNLTGIAEALRYKNILSPNPNGNTAYRFTEDANDMADAINDFSYIVPSGTKTIYSSGTHNVESYKYASVAAGSCTVSGGGLTAGSGAVSATGTNVSLTELSAAPSSGAYITVTGSGSVSRAAITKTQTAGYISAGSSTSSSATSKSSNTATKYYAISTNDDVYLYGVYEFISTPTGSGLSYNWGSSVSEPITFGWTGTSSGSPGTVYENIRDEISVQYGSYGLVIWYGSDVAYTNTTYGDISSYTGWQAIDGMSSTTTRTIIIATPYRISSSSTFYQWFSNNTERVGDWDSGGGSSGGNISVATATVEVDSQSSDYDSSNTHFYYTAYENGEIRGKTVDSNAAQGATLENVVVGTYLIYHCNGNIAISPNGSGATWLDDIDFTAYNMAHVFRIDTTGTINFGTYTDCCFDGQSKVLMADNTEKALVDIAIGDMVMTYDEITGVSTTNEVTALGTVELNNSTNLTLEDGTVIHMNKYHPMWTESGWKSIVGYKGIPRLTTEDKLLNNNGEYVAIKSIEKVEIEKETYYTIKVANNNNFYVNRYLAQGKDKD